MTLNLRRGCVSGTRIAATIASAAVTTTKRRVENASEKQVTREGNDGTSGFGTTYVDGVANDKTGAIFSCWGMRGNAGCSICRVPEARR